MTKQSILLILLIISSLTTFGQVRMARIFSDHVVLQRQQPIPVWGWAKPGETVKATLAGQTQQAKPMPMASGWFGLHPSKQVAHTHWLPPLNRAVPRLPMC